MVRRAAFLGIAVLCAAISPARAQTAGDFAGGQFWPTGTANDNVFLDLALVPESYYQLNALGQPIAGERLAVWANLDTRSFDGKVKVVTSFRYDFDSGAAYQRSSTGDLLIMPNSYALLQAYLEYDATDFLQFRIGRQFYMDQADFLAFDGAKIQWKLPAPVPLQLEVYGGIRSNYAVSQDSQLPSQYELDGVAQENGTQPVFGVGLRWIGNMLYREEASVGFRESWDLDESGQPFGLPNSGTFVNSQEFVASASRDVGPLYLSGGFAMSLVLDRVERAQASLVLPISKLKPLTMFGSKGDLDISLNYQRFQPVFSLDSIFNYFIMYPYDEGNVGVTVHAGNLRFEANGFARIFYAEGFVNGLILPTVTNIEPAYGGRANFAWSFAHNNDVLDAGILYEDGFGGSNFMIDGGLRGRVPNLPLEAYGRLTVTNWNEELITTNAGTSLGLVGGATWHFPFGASASLILEEDAMLNVSSETTNFTSPVPRVFIVLDVSRWM